MKIPVVAAASAACCVFTLLFVGCAEDKGVSDQAALASGQAAAGPASGLPAGVAQSREKAHGAVINFEKTVLDMGQVAPRSDNLAEFRFVNEGSAELQITKISKTCGCTPFTLEKDNYMPGEEGLIKVRYHAGSQPGATAKRLYVESNDPDKPKVALTLRAEIVEKVAYEPKQIKFMPQEDNGGCPDIVLRSLDGKPFSITALRVPDNCLTADIDPSVQALEFVLKPRVDMAKIMTRKNGRLDLDITHPDCKSVSIPYSVTPEFTVSPGLLNIIQAPAGVPVNRTVYITNNYGRPCEVESVSSRSGLARLVSWQKMDSNHCLLEVEIIPPDAAEARGRTFRDRLSINMVGGEKLEVTCVGQNANETESTSSVSE